jgi:hypothetical protein
MNNWDTAPCSFEVYWRFRGAYCLHHQRDEWWRQYAYLKRRYTSTKLQVLYPWRLLYRHDNSSLWWWRQYAPMKRRYTSTRLHQTIYQKAVIFILAAVRTWNLTGACNYIAKAVGLFCAERCKCRKRLQQWNPANIFTLHAARNVDWQHKRRFSLLMLEVCFPCAIYNFVGIHLRTDFVDTFYLVVLVDSPSVHELSTGTVTPVDYWQLCSQVALLPVATPTCLLLPRILHVTECRG